MKNEKLQDAIGLIGDDLIEEANGEIKINTKKYWISGMAACLTAVIILGVIFIPSYEKNKNLSNFTNLTAYAINEAEYPKTVDYPDSESPNFYEEEKAWQKNRDEHLKDYDSETMNTSAFFKNSFEVLLSDTKGKNRVYSPLNIYFALSMLAEITDNNSRKEILDVLASYDIEQHRKTANAIFKANYYDDKRVSSIFANSLWLNEKINFNNDTIKRVADSYYASSYSGEMGSKDFNNALISWVNKNTKNLLTDQSQNIEMNRNTVISLASTIYFKAAWTDKFHQLATKKQSFYEENDSYAYDFMNMSRMGTVYYGNDFSAAKLSLDGSGYMYFILPQKNSSVDEVVKNKQVAELITMGDTWENKAEATINYSIPKFDVVSSINLKDSFKKLGIKDVFNRLKSDFTPLTDEKFLETSSVQHSARVMIDEDGCTGAAYTLITVEGTSMPPQEIIDFTLDRPFIFAVKSETGDVLFAGVVNSLK